MATTTLTLDEVIDQVCPKFCGACAAELPRPGEECASCGELPSLLRREAAEQLAAPGELARKQAEHHRAEAKRLLGEQADELLAADQALYLDQLRQARDRAADELTAAVARRDQAEAALKTCRSAEARAGRERAEADGARQEFDLEARRAERYKKGTKAIVLARQAVALADDELAGKNTALTAAQDARRRAEDVFGAAAAEVTRLTAVRDAAEARVTRPGECGFSMENLKTLAAPVLAIAEAVAPLRLDRPAFQFTPADVMNDIRIAFAIATAGKLAELTGLRSAEHVA